MQHRLKLFVRFSLILLLLALARGSGAATVQVSVAANQAWTDTGIDLALGSSVTITASGTIRIAGSDPGKTPAGAPECSAPSDFVAPGLPCWSLIGRIGSGTPFYVGTAKGFSVTTSGRLFLGVNDNFFPDNSGSWAATVSEETLGSITAHKFQDTNKNQIQDPGEPDISGWETRLHHGSGCAGDPIVPPQTTDTNGNAMFSDLTAGDYSISETWRMEWINTTQWCQVVANLEDGQSLVVNFGNVPETAAIMQPPSTGYIGYLFRMLFSDRGCDRSPTPDYIHTTHSGIDIWTDRDTGGGVNPSSPRGNEVRAAFGGILTGIFNADNKRAVTKDKGPAQDASILFIDLGVINGTRLYTVYAHMGKDDRTQTFIDPGLRLKQQITKGQLLGYQGNAHGTASPNSQFNGNGPYITHLHFEVKTDAKKGYLLLDPSPFLGRQVNRCNSSSPAFLDRFP